MSTDIAMKVDADHLRRDAFLYVRQSSLRQVFENTESTKRQYALRDRAVALGWPIERVHVIDSDLGLSGAQLQDRDGFKHLVTEVAMGHAGIVLGLELSRLARNNADWHLLELAALSRTLIMDEDGVYDPACVNDRMLLGLKGKMREAELHILKSRLQAAINKARRGEVEMPLPIGLVYTHDARVVHRSRPTDPGHGAAPVRYLPRDRLGLRRRAPPAGREAPLSPASSRHRQGRRPVERDRPFLRAPDSAQPAICRRVRLWAYPHRLQCQAQVRAGSRGDIRLAGAYSRSPRGLHFHIPWAEYERNQTSLEQNSAGFSPGLRGRMPRQGSGLLQGRLLCGRCGARMRVHYEPFEGRLRPYYVCNEAVVRHAGKHRQRVRGAPVDGRRRGERATAGGDGAGSDRCRALPCSRRSPSAWSRPRRCAARSCNAPAMRLNWPADAT